MVKIVPKRFGLMVLIMYMETLGMQIQFSGINNIKVFFDDVWLDFGKYHDKLDIRGKLVSEIWFLISISTLLLSSFTISARL